MDRKHITLILGYLKVAYPYFYKGMEKKDAEEIIVVWQDLFSDCNFELVFTAVKELINSSDNPYPPTIAEIKNKMYELTTEDKTPTDFWNELVTAIKDSGYHSKEQFEKLSPECKEFIKNPAQLKELAMMDSKTVHSVTKGQFLRQMEQIQKRVKEKALMLNTTKQLKLDLSVVGKDISGLLN